MRRSPACYPLAANRLGIDPAVAIAIDDSTPASVQPTPPAWHVVAVTTKTYEAAELTTS